MRKFYPGVLRFTVLVKDRFPFHMLRTDCCFPASTKDANLLGETGPRAITLAKLSAGLSGNGDADGLSYDAWKSHGCRIEGFTVCFSNDTVEHTLQK